LRMGLYKYWLNQLGKKPTKNNILTQVVNHFTRLALDAKVTSNTIVQDLTNDTSKYVQFERDATRDVMGTFKKVENDAAANEELSRNPILKIDHELSNSTQTYEKNVRVNGKIQKKTIHKYILPLVDEDDARQIFDLWNIPSSDEYLKNRKVEPNSYVPHETPKQLKERWKMQLEKKILQQTEANVKNKPAHQVLLERRFLQRERPKDVKIAKYKLSRIHFRSKPVDKRFLRLLPMLAKNRMENNINNVSKLLASKKKTLPKSVHAIKLKQRRRSFKERVADMRKRIEYMNLKKNITQSKHQPTPRKQQPKQQLTQTKAKN